MEPEGGQMSGGAWDYSSGRVDECAMRMRRWDVELADLLEDLAAVCHECEWADSGDTGREGAEAEIARLKEKWFGRPRAERLRGYVDERTEAVRAELLKLIGGAK